MSQSSAPARRGGKARLAVGTLGPDDELCLGRCRRAVPAGARGGVRVVTPRGRSPAPTPRWRWSTPPAASCCWSGRRATARCPGGRCPPLGPASVGSLWPGIGALLADSSRCWTRSRQRSPPARGGPADRGGARPADRGGLPSQRPADQDERLLGGEQQTLVVRRSGLGGETLGGGVRDGQGDQPAAAKVVRSRPPPAPPTPPEAAHEATRPPAWPDATPPPHPYSSLPSLQL